MPKSSIADALNWFKVADEAFSKQRTREKDDLKCQTPEGLWPDEIKEARSSTVIAGQKIPARPMLSIPTMDEPVQLVLNGQRKAHLGVNIHPLSEDATDDTAEVLQGLYRACERESRAHMVRAWAFDRATKCGMGWYRWDKVFDPDGGHPLDQKLVLKRILYQGAVTPDPFAQEADWSDGKRLMYVVDLPLAVYKARYGKSKVAETADDGELVSLGSEAPDWIGGDTDARVIRVAEDWRVEIESKKHVLLDDNSMAPEGKIPEGRTVHTGDKARAREIETRKVFWRVINCCEEIEPEQEWDGQYIPFIPAIGRELQPFDGKRIWYGMYSTAKDGARLVNYGASGAVERASLEPKVPWQGEEGVFEGHEEEYRQSNIRNIPFVQFRRTGLAGIPADKPERVQVETKGISLNLELMGIGRDIVQAATSTFDPALGKQPTAHRSGRALIALQDQTVEGTSHYLDNLAEISMPQEARIWLDLAPHVYDRPGRITRILNEGGDSSLVMLQQDFMLDPQTKRPRSINPAMPGVAANADNPVKRYDLNKGRYGVSVTIGKAGERLQQASEEISDVMGAMPAMIPIIGAEYFKFRDFPGAKTIAELLKKMRDHDFPWLSDKPTQDAAAQLSKTQAELAQVTQAATQMKKDLDTDKVKQDGQVAIAKLKFDLELEIVKVQNAAKIEIARITAAKQSADLAAEAREEEIALGREHAHEVSTIDQEHQNAKDLAAQAHAQAIQQGDLAHQQTLVQGEQAQSHNLEGMAAQPPEPTTGTTE